jgi:hypothetical protein
MRPEFCTVVRLGCCIYQISKELGDENELFNEIAEFEDLYNVAAMAPIECCAEHVRLEA